MSLRNARQDAPAVHVPASAADHPSWGRVAVIAAIGFGIGVAWPRLAGIRPGPSVPEASADSAPAGSAPVPAPVAPAPVASASSVAGRAEPGAAPIVQSAAASPAPTSAVHVSVSHGFVSSCRTTDGQSLKGSDCGDLAGLDGVVLPRLRKLAECPASADASGKLHLVLHVDFTRGALTADVGRGRNVSAADPILACARTALADAPVGGIRHDSTRYNVAYVVTLAGADGAAAAGPSASASSSASPPAAGDGTAQVEWDVAIVRDAPKSGKVIAKLQKGSTLRIGPVNDGWYPVKYGDDFANEGWVYRGAIGR